VGRYYPVEKLVEIVLRDVPYYLPSAGGVTLTGGECTMYPDYLESLLILLKSHHVHVVLETAGCFDYEVFRQQVLPYVDLVYFDVKFADPVLHQQHTGSPNGPILHNLARLLKEPGVAVQARVPLVPGVTATDDNLREIARLLREMGAKEASLLPYNPLGLEMWAKLGKRRPALSPSFMPAHREEALGASFKALLQATATPAD
jgi:pyruvate formate lyase activating enzyme